jgi:transglutaminase-like putative cysteine protease
MSPGPEVTARYRIEHCSIYEYDGNVTTSFNEARLTPQQTPWQTRLESTITIDPMTWSDRYTDYWGTEVRVFEASQPHRSLDVRATSVVEVDRTGRPRPAELGWADVRTDAVRDRYIEFLTQRPATEPATEIADLAASIAADQPPTLAAASISAWVNAAMTYLPGATAVHTTAAEAWSERHGVCQDYAHLVVGALRHIGVPARYVSGYLHPNAEPEVGETARGESHAWVEYWLGDWQAYDPTNLADVGERHVVVGTGRDYGDVPPIKGIVAGEHETVSLAVTVDLTRLA